MSEIERAIECFNNKVWSGELFESEVDMYNAVVVVLRAELEREKNPLTCDGCKTLSAKFGFLGDKYYLCEECSRGTILPDRYEPKGEKA